MPTQNLEAYLEARLVSNSAQNLKRIFEAFKAVAMPMRNDFILAEESSKALTTFLTQELTKEIQAKVDTLTPTEQQYVQQHLAQPLADAAIDVYIAQLLQAVRGKDQGAPMREAAEAAKLSISKYLTDQLQSNQGALSLRSLAQKGIARIQQARNTTAQTTVKSQGLRR